MLSYERRLLEIKPGAPSPLKEAACEGHVEMMRALLALKDENGRRVHAQGMHERYVGLGLCKTAECAEILLANGADVHEVWAPPILDTPFFRVLTWLIVQTHRPGEFSPFRSINGSMAHQFDATPLHCAAMMGNGPVCRVLLDHGADPWRRHRMDMTPREVAAEFGFDYVVEMIRKAEDARPMPARVVKPKPQPVLSCCAAATGVEEVFSPLPEGRLVRAA